MAKSATAGAAYCLIVFLLGFVLGSTRVLLVAPRLGETMAVLLETPLMLAASWAFCGWCLRRFEVVPKADAGVVMGGVAFALLMGVELAVSVLLFGRSPNGFVSGYRTTPGAIGLAAEVAFGLMPLARLCAGLIEKHQIRPGNRSEERRPGQGLLIHSGSSPTKRLRPRDLLSRANTLSARTQQQAERDTSGS